ncbi:MAG: hypothetical protein CL840_08290 [Crocinitomicaceae bacterium]|nr:hypothetical protein [Crocinitomicaceae bacterium]
MINVKHNYPAAENQTYLNTPACGLLSKKTAEALNRFHEDFLNHGSPVADQWMLEEVPKTRQLVAKFVNADVENIALVPNFSFGYNSLLDSIGPKKTLVYSRDYPSLKIPLELKGFELIEVEDKHGFEIDQAELFDNLIKNEIELLVISHVQFRTGFLIDLKSVGDFCKENGILFIVDATQSAGASLISYRDLNIDALIWSNYKWMNAGFATGIMCLRSGLIDKFPPRIGGYGSFFVEGDQLVYRPSSRSFEPSHPNMAGLVALNSAVEEKLSLGLETINAHNSKLLQLLTSQLDHYEVPYYGQENKKGSRAFVVLPSTSTDFEKLKQEKIITTFREGYIRLGAHFYNEESDIERFIQIIANR